MKLVIFFALFQSYQSYAAPVYSCDWIVSDQGSYCNLTTENGESIDNEINNKKECLKKCDTSSIRPDISKVKPKTLKQNQR